MSMITVSRPDVTREEVIKVLRGGLGARYHVLPGKTTTGADDPDALVVGTGTDRVFRARLRLTHHDTRTEIRVHPSGVVAIRVLNTVGIARKVRRALIDELGGSR
jgi:hypothetical protein